MPTENKPTQAPSLKLRQNQDTLVDQPILETERERQESDRENKDDTPKEPRKPENTQTTKPRDGTNKEDDGEEKDEGEGTHIYLKFIFIYSILSLTLTNSYLT